MIDPFSLIVGLLVGLVFCIFVWLIVYSIKLEYDRKIEVMFSNINKYMSKKGGFK